MDSASKLEALLASDEASPPQIKPSRTESQNLAELTGKCRSAARVALDATGYDSDLAYRLLMSDLVLAAVDGLACEIEPMKSGILACLGGTPRTVRSVGAFSGYSVLRVDRDRQEDLQLCALEAVEVCLLTKSKAQVAPHWEVLESPESPDVEGVDGSTAVQTRSFDPGVISLPVVGVFLLMARPVKHKRLVAPPKNTRPSRRRRATAPADDPKAATGGSGAGSAHPPAHKDYQVLESVGRGSFGTVFLAKDEHGQRVAIKRVVADADGNMREVELLRKVSHPCVVAFLDSYDRAESGSKGTLHIVMEFMPQNLHQRIGGKPIEVGDLRCFLFQLLRALVHLDVVHICHRDLKPENLLVDGRSLKVADFGSAKMLDKGPSSSYICSRWWRAPELIVGSSEYSISVDWWSCGCVAAEMMLGRPLLMGDTNWAQMYEITRVLGTPDLKQVQALHPASTGRMGKHLSKLAELRRPARRWEDLLPAYAAMPEALDFPARLVVYNPNARAHPAEVLDSPFFVALTDDDGQLPESIFDFTKEELEHSKAKTTLLAFAARRKPSATSADAETSNVAGTLCTGTESTTSRPAGTRRRVAGTTGTGAEASTSSLAGTRRPREFDGQPLEGESAQKRRRTDMDDFSDIP